MSRSPRPSVLSTWIATVQATNRTDDSALARLARAALLIAVVVLAIPIAALLLAIGLVLGSVVAVLALVHSIRMRRRHAGEPRDGRENVRVIPRPPRGGEGGSA